MERPRHRAAPPERIDPRRLWWAGPLTIAAALAANAVVRGVAVALFAISPTFHNLAWTHLAWVTVAAVGTAVLVFAAVVHYAEHPVRLYRRVAAVGLAGSFVPNVWLALADVDGASPAALATLAAMHVVDAALCVWLLPSLARAREPRPARIRDHHEATASRR